MCLNFWNHEEQKFLNYLNFERKVVYKCKTERVHTHTHRFPLPSIFLNQIFNFSPLLTLPWEKNNLNERLFWKEHTRHTRLYSFSSLGNTGNLSLSGNNRTNPMLPNPRTYLAWTQHCIPGPVFFFIKTGSFYTHLSFFPLCFPFLYLLRGFVSGCYLLQQFCLIFNCLPKVTIT